MSATPLTPLYNPQSAMAAAHHHPDQPYDGADRNSNHLQMAYGSGYQVPVGGPNGQFHPPGADAKAMYYRSPKSAANVYAVDHQDPAAVTQALGSGIYRVATAPPNVTPGSLLPSAFEMTPPDSHSRPFKRSYDTAALDTPLQAPPSYLQGDVHYAYRATPTSIGQQRYANMSVTPGDPAFVAPVRPGSTPQQPKFHHQQKPRMPQAPMQSQHQLQLQTPMTERRGSVPVVGGNGGDVFAAENAQLLNSAPISDHAAYSGYLARQKKDSNDEAGSVWSKDVEEAFMEALRKIPRVGRRKITICGRPCGRNEIISDYIFKKTGKVRTRKQVSSHIQVLKHLLKDDPDFMALVADSPPGNASTKVPVVSPIFSKNSAGASEQAAKRLHPTSTADLFLASPGRRADSVVNGAGAGTDVNSLAPANFCIWHAGDASKNIPQRVYTQLIRPQFETPLKPKGFENIAERFPRVADLLKSGAVSHIPLVYGKVKLDIRNDQLPFTPESFRTSLQFNFPLHSRRVPGFNGSPGGVAGRFDHRWEVVTSVSTMSHQVLELREPVSVQENLVQRVEKLLIPFSTEFWAAFVGGFRNKDADSQDAYTAISAITVTQKLYCRPVGNLCDTPDEDEASDLEAIIIYEFEKAADSFSARTVFRKLILPEVADSSEPSSATSSDREVEYGYSDAPVQQPQPQSSVHPQFIAGGAATSMGSPLSRKGAPAASDYGELMMGSTSSANPQSLMASAGFNDLGSAAAAAANQAPIAMSRSFSVAEAYHANGGDAHGTTHGGEMIPMTSLAENAESLGMVRSMTAFVGTSNPWVGAGFDTTGGLYGDNADGWYQGNGAGGYDAHSDNQADVIAAAAAAAAAATNGTDDEEIHAPITVKAKEPLHVDAISYASFEDQAPLKSAPPTYNYRSFSNEMRGVKEEDETGAE